MEGSAFVNMKHLLESSGLPMTLNTLQECINVIDNHTDTIAEYINAGELDDEDDVMKIHIHWLTLVQNYLETLNTKEHGVQ